MPNHRKTKYVLAATLTPLAFAALYALTPYYSTQFLWELRKSLFWTVPLLLVIAVAIVGFAAYIVYGEKHSVGDYRSPKDKVRTCRLIGVGAVVVSLLALSGAIGFWVWHGYAQDKVYASSYLVKVGEPLPELSIRAPYSVAQAQSRTTLSNTPGAELIDSTTMYAPSSTEFTTLAKGRQFLGNYAAVAVQKFPLTGRSTGSQCTFSEDANRSLSGWLHHNLGRAINSERRGVNWSVDDAYGICDKEGTPWVVVPLKKQVGWAVVTERPAGVALYNGSTGALEVHDDAPEWVNGVTYPMSLAEKQRESGTALGTWMQWWRNLIGWKTAEGDANAINGSEYVLGNDEDSTVYTTLLSNQGNSTGIAAVSTVDAHRSVNGELTPYVVYTFPAPWVSVDAITSRIKADYQDIPNWQTLHVQEIAPLDAQRWVATIGNDQNTLYRVVGSGTLEPMPGAAGDAATCLYQGTDAKPRRCGTLALADGNGIGTQYGPADTGQNPAAVSPPAGVPLRELSDAELADLLRRIAAELDTRAGQR